MPLWLSRKPSLATVFFRPWRTSRHAAYWAYFAQVYCVSGSPSGLAQSRLVSRSLVVNPPSCLKSLHTLIWNTIISIRVAH
ncbi:hypothetical protein BN2475_110039 [Paraburkholderia ribeironis]|uniref:Uncharacterized protein n=1 Tax=Paraburkholderia ribeironis TaxID=1247936 RepID=A0A1N7RQH2_9BURK|nr:hypothetical protein BN2475_110039 [Paraburkholderia ribeironis]